MVLACPQLVVDCTGIEILVAVSGTVPSPLRYPSGHNLQYTLWSAGSVLAPTYLPAVHAVQDK